MSYNKNKSYNKDSNKSGYKKDTRKKGSNKKEEVNKDQETFSNDQTPRDNDPGYYFTNAEIADQATQLSFQSFLGYGAPIANVKIPTILRIETVLNPGQTYPVLNATDTYPVSVPTNAVLTPATLGIGKAGVNLMASKLYTLMSAFTGRTASYAPQDIALQILALASLCETTEHLRRAFGCILTYDERNRTLSGGLIRAMGFDYEDFCDNLSIYRTKFNTALQRINQIPMLANIAIIQKSRSTYQKVYQDEETTMPQLFFYAPRYGFVLDEVGDGDGSVLRAIPLTDTAQAVGTNAWTHTVDWFIDFINEQITALLESSTMNFIYADILNMARKIDVPMWKFDYLSETYIVKPEFWKNALLQLHNLTIAGVPYNEGANWFSGGMMTFGAQKHSLIAGNIGYYVTEGADIFCEPGKNNIVYNPLFDPNNYGTQGAVLKRCLIDVDNANPSLEDKIEMLRYTTLHSGAFVTQNDWMGGSGTDAFPCFATFPDHYVARMFIFSNIRGEDNDLTATILSGCYVGGQGDASVRILTQLDKFKSSPYIYVLDYLSGAQQEDILRISGDVNFYSEVDYKYVSRLNNAMSIGLYDFRVKSTSSKK